MNFMFSWQEEEGEKVFGLTDLALKSAQIVDFCGKSSRIMDFENTVDRGSAVIMPVLMFKSWFLNEI